MFNILIVEDEVNILKLMQIRLEKSGFKTYTAENGKEALEVLAKNTIHLAIVDIMMPVMDGYEFVEKVRESGSNLPIILATAKETIEDKARGFKLGVDDYMIKPINHEELVLRINAILKRANVNDGRVLQLGDIVLDLANLEIRDENNTVYLTKKEHDLLYKLFSSPGMTLTKGQLLDDVWGYDCESYEETLKVHVSRIRQKLEPFKKLQIETVRGVGYKGVISEK